MKISDVEFSAVEIPRNDGGSPVRSLLVCLTTDSGDEGWGEAPLAWRVSELSDRRRVLLPMLAGRGVFDTEELLTADWLTDPGLRCALEMAALDLVGQVAGLPLSHLWGGLWRQHIPLAVRLPVRSPDEIHQASGELAEQGFHTQLVTTTGNAEADIETVQAVAMSVADRAELIFDAAGQYDAVAARQLATDTRFRPVTLMLNPLSTSSFEQSASLCRQVTVRTALAAHITGPVDVMSAVRLHAAEHVVIDLFRVGGLSAARKCVAIAEAGGLAVSLSAERSVGIALAAMLQLTASTPALDNSNLNDCYYVCDDVLGEPIEFIDGLASVPCQSGLGIRIDRGKVDRFQSSWSISANEGS